MDRRSIFSTSDSIGKVICFYEAILLDSSRENFVALGLNHAVPDMSQNMRVALIFISVHYTSGLELQHSKLENSDKCVILVKLAVYIIKNFVLALYFPPLRTT